MRWKRCSAPERTASNASRWLRPAIAAAVSLLASCTDSPAPEAGCVERFWVRPADRGARVELVGSWDDFARPGVFLTARDDGWFTAAKALPPGPVRYAFVVDGRWTRDVTEPLEETVRGEPVTRRDVRDCAQPQVALARVRTEAGAIRFDAKLTAGGDGTPITALTARDLATGTETPIPLEPTARGTVGAALPVPAAKRCAFEVIARDALGREARARTFTWTDGVTDADRIGYQVLPDRFRGDGGTALRVPSPLAARAGGTLRGITAELRAGSITALATNTLWLMPIVQNTRGFFDIGDGASGTGYHGYWTTSPTAIEPGLGTDDDLRELLEEAHARGVRVILDVVPNHVHDEHPYWRAHPEWFQGRPGSCTCGSATCPWDTAIERCWFAPYMPDVDWGVPEAAEAMTRDAAAWLERFPFDGLRIDAVPMMPRGASRAIVQRARSRVAEGSSDLLTLGEIFTGPGAYDVLRYYLGPFGLSSTFHFPLFWALRGALVAESEPLGAIASVLAASDTAFAGSGALLTTFVGSHDVARVASVAHGSSEGRFELEPFATDARTWARLRLAFGALYTLPGFPMLYQGDELGMPGMGDPVTRLPMPDRAALPAESRALEAHVRSLAQLRACSPSLRRGALEVLLASDEALVFTRTDAASGDRALIALTRAPGAPLRVPLPVLFRGTLRDYFQDATTSLGDELTIPSTPTRTLRVWLPPESPCRAP